MQPEALNCPNCGGTAATGRPKCDFCGSRLRTVACPSCLGMMFLGSKFCSHCGNSAQPAQLLDTKDTGDCPRCKVQLQLLKIDEVLIRECERCGGFWSNTQTFEDLCASKEQQSSVLGFIGSYVHSDMEPAKISYVPCPDCKELMNRSNFARSSGVIIDRCKQHGVWFDAAELPKILEFVDSGGLARQREKEKIELEDERSRLREERRRLDMQARRSGGDHWGD
ncbi:MAG: zf-TFIIB domain-containing protein [Acidobacteria bacterium]|nr:zf-TFIIB domain-containing protein [Acidobacteriota bacterium]